MDIVFFLKKKVKFILFLIVDKKYRSRKPVIRSFDETLNYMLENPCSVSRYGDGEMDLICGEGNGFCAYNEQLANRLREVLSSDRKEHIICLPYQIVSLKPFTEKSNVFWRNHLLKRLSKWVEFTRPGKIYYCAQVSRFYIPFKDRSDCGESILKLKSLWQDRDVLIVEGEATRMGIGNDLFDNVRSIKRILCPAINAFEKYDEILESVGCYAEDKLILIALGQTATVLAYDLAVKGHRAVDIGHIDLEYEWFLKGVDRPVNIANKYVNEAVGGDSYDETGNLEYQAQILVKI